MAAVMCALINHGAGMTGNQLGRACGFAFGQDDKRHAHDGRKMGPANRVIFSVIALINRGLVRRDFSAHHDNTIFVLTNAGREFCKKMALEKKQVY
jgi:hypothetical protein